MAKSLKLRSWLIVEPSTDPAEAAFAGADRLVIDLREYRESHAAAVDGIVRTVAGRCDSPPAFLLPGFSSGRTDAALGVALRCGTDLIVLAEAQGGPDVQRLDAGLRVAEIRENLLPGSVAIVALANAAGILAVAGFRRSSARLAALGHGPDTGQPSDVTAFSDAAVSLAAASAGIPAIAPVSPAGDGPAFRDDCLRAAQNGFAGRFCRRNDQIPIINHIFGDQPPAPGGRVISKTSEPPSE